jgi:hypothetical protein
VDLNDFIKAMSSLGNIVMRKTALTYPDDFAAGVRNIRGVMFCDIKNAIVETTLHEGMNTTLQANRPLQMPWAQSSPQDRCETDSMSQRHLILAASFRATAR